MPVSCAIRLTVGILVTLRQQLLFQSIPLSKVRSHIRGSENEGTPPRLRQHQPYTHTVKCEMNCQTSKLYANKVVYRSFLSRGSVRHGIFIDNSNEVEHTALYQLRFPSVSVTTVSRNFPDRKSIV